ncbi:MAG: DNA-protecting protein DprA [Planctomycetes bacterium]|nr:DNA-protecting protein DprA [Planctomycetota bacterium]
MDAYLMLALAEGFGEGLVEALLAPDLDPRPWLEAPPQPPEVPPRVAARLRDPGLESAAAAVRRNAALHGLHVLTPDHADWPPQFSAMPLRPLVLFARGDLAALQRRPAAAMIGSRTPTPYGSEAAQQFAGALAHAGICLWSGLARGIDGIAHERCTAAGVPTVAVLAGGLDRIYPPEHHALAERMLTTGGCLLSELPPGRTARRGHFPRRNRLIATGTPSVIVIEASLSSGALHTARFAAECSTTVFALPGPWASERSQGCHRLIQEGASLLESPETLLRDLGVQAQQTGPQALALTGSADELAILQHLQQGPRPSDLLQRESGLDRATFLRALFALHGRGLLQRLAGDLWSRLTPG